MGIEEKINGLKYDIEESENSLKDPDIQADTELVSLLNDAILKAKKEIEELEAESAKAVKSAEEKVKESVKEGDKAEIKQAKEELSDAKSDEKELAKVSDKLAKVSDKIEKVSGVRGGTRLGAGRKPILGRMEKPKGGWGGKRLNEEGKPLQGRKKKVFSETKMVTPKGLKVVPLKRKAKKVSSKVQPKKVVVSKEKSVRAFGQTVTYKNDAEFCSQLIKAFKKRRLASKKDGKRRKTKPVFGVIATSVKNAVSKALHSVSTTEIQKNPKQFLAKATRLEKSAIRFLEDFKSILGSDYKKSEITSEFGELEIAIKQFVAKYTKKK